jgi:hypothetical protein
MTRALGLVPLAGNIRKNLPVCQAKIAIEAKKTSVTIDMTGNYLLTKVDPT